MVRISGRRRAVLNGGVTFQDVGPAAPLCRYDCLGSVQQGRHTITREEDYVFDLRCAQRGVVQRACASVAVNRIRSPTRPGSPECTRRSPVFFTIMLALLHRLFQFFLVIGKQGMNLAVRFRR
jgi:hypothetical protein